MRTRAVMYLVFGFFNPVKNFRENKPRKTQPTIFFLQLFGGGELMKNPKPDFFHQPKTDKFWLPI